MKIAFSVGTYSVDSAFTLPEPQMIGYSFDGWYTSPNFTTRVTDITLGTTGDKSLYAKWIPYGAE